MATPNLKSIATVTPGILDSRQLANGANTVYTVPASKAVKLASLVLANVTAVPVTVTVSIVPSGGAVDGTHVIVSAYVLAANDSVTITEVAGLWMGDGDKVAINSSAAASVDSTLSGLLFA